MPKSAKKCIASWRKFFPDYEIKEWNEDNFDVNIIPYTKQAYEAKKYAFVSDFARFWILYNYGGLYFDTDVEVIRPMDDIISKGPFMGIEIPARGDGCPQVNPGLGVGADAGIILYKAILDNYSLLSFHNEDGSLNLKTVVAYTTEALAGLGLEKVNDIQEVSGVWIYPVDYLNPLDSVTRRLMITENTRSIHWYMNSWGRTTLVRRWVSAFYHRIFRSE